MTNAKEKKKIVLWLIVLAILAAAAFTVTAIVRHNQRPAWDGGYSVHISEVMTDNKTCPNGEGVLCDWIEIENTSSEDFSIGGYYLSDEAGKGKYCFPAGSVVPARGYLVVWCSPDEAGDYAPFALRKAGGETVCLINENRTVLDSAVTAACRSGQSLVRGGDGALVPSDTPTPGYPNSETGAKAWQEALAQRSGGTLELSEIMSSNTLYAAPDGYFYDWIEVHNPSDSPVSLSGYKRKVRRMLIACPVSFSVSPFILHTLTMRLSFTRITTSIFPYSLFPSISSYQPPSYTLSAPHCCGFSLSRIHLQSDSSASTAFFSHQSASASHFTSLIS